MFCEFKRKKGGIYISEQILKLVSPISPSVNHYLAYRAIIKNGKPMAMSYKTSEATKYQKDFTSYAIEQAKLQNWSKSDNKFQHYYMDTYFYFPRTDMDANNYFKCMADAITESAKIWIDDNQLCERVQGIWYDSKNPRVEMWIKKVDYIGIFKDVSQLDAFISNNCVQCNRYKNGKCSLLVKSKEGRIIEEIVDLKCSKFKGVK
jgi:Holliday junction resolvase RusA-like endonuclease